jgi:hypothetical protein
LKICSLSIRIFMRLQQIIADFFSALVPTVYYMSTWKHCQISHDLPPTRR